MGFSQVAALPDNFWTTTFLFFPKRVTFGLGYCPKNGKRGYKPCFKRATKQFIEK